VFDGILDHRPQQQRRHGSIASLLFQIDDDGKPRSEAHLLDAEVIADERELLGERHLFPLLKTARISIEAAQAFEHPLSFRRIVTNQSGHEAEPPVVVFTTAYDSYAVQAFQANALDYLLKPIDAGRFHESAARVRASLSKRTDWSEKAAALLAQIEQRDQTLRRIAVKNGGRILFVDVADVEWFEAAGNYVRLHTAKTAHLVRTTMAALERKLDRSAFVRIHRSVIVNVARITELEARFRGRLCGGAARRQEARLATGVRERASRSHGRVLKDAL
jgi:DNA-binding LytR/AlgR family response regulator